MKQTAVDYIRQHFICDYELEKLFQEAKKMEKEQMIEFANNFYDDCVLQYGGLEQSVEQYYKEVYETK